MDYSPSLESHFEGIELSSQLSSLIFCLSLMQNQALIGP